MIYNFHSLGLFILTVLVPYYFFIDVIVSKLFDINFTRKETSYCLWVDPIDKPEVKGGEGLTLQDISVIVFVLYKFKRYCNLE